MKKISSLPRIRKRIRNRNRLRKLMTVRLKKRSVRKAKLRNIILLRKKRSFKKRQLIKKKQKKTVQKLIHVQPIHSAIPIHPDLPAVPIQAELQEHTPPPVEDYSEVPPQQLEPGVSLIGYTRTEIGLGEACRLMAKTFETVQLPFGILSFTDPGAISARNNDTSWVHKEMNHAPYKVNLLHMNAPNLRWAFDLNALPLGKGLLKHRYNIGYWAWEMPDFPDEWCNSFELVQEVWAPSSFIVESIKKKSPVPVIRIPHAIEVRGQDRNRSVFGLPENQFLFLAMYDTHSLKERKNPQGSIEAFKRAFTFNDTSVGLVIKVNNPNTNPAEMESLKELIHGYSNIYLIQEILDRDKVDVLINSSDCFMSLHRSEGFGLVLAEAMYLGKPVIGTNWSGNTDFMNADNSCLVNYSLAQLGRDLGPYKAFQIWAEPDIDHAAYFMRKLVNDTRWRNSIALRGQQTIRNDYSPAVIGEMAKKRLMEVSLTNDPPSY
ncbi:glycosyltransferase [Paenibacillus sp. LMG 31456]|uniref:Glycosyltransferase n=1 Tax=Paenibacillus foliorum TaxID=2654974 RepID=A0A972K5U2_9BACL|nr:glycosyltransferase [Paenibacillus foliorum]NOU98348.1 glycosyltransferase [Paenibacillus foliorum]